MEKEKVKPIHYGTDIYIKMMKVYMEKSKAL